MSKRPQTKGACVYCGKSMTGTGMTRHLETCPERQAKIAAANARAGTVQSLFHLVVRDRYRPEYWLHLEMNGSSPLTNLDRYLRAIWLECCGHMSEFQLKTWGEKVPSSWTASRVFGSLDEITHVYDFGTTSETVIRMVGSRQGKPLTRHPLALMARNDPPEYTCMECDNPAAYFCSECQIERDETGLLCAEHLEGHPCEDYGEPIPLVNSPRMGMCGYDGPGLPPY